MRLGRPLIANEESGGDCMPSSRVIKEVPGLRQVGTSHLRMRVIEPAPGKPLVVDIREFIESSTFTGWTRRGIRLDAEAFSALIEAAKAIREALIADPARPAVTRSRSVGLGKRHY